VTDAEIHAWCLVTVTATDTATTEPSQGDPQRRSVWHRTLWRRAYRGREDDPIWVRPALIGLLVATGALYLWGLSASDWANAFYSAAVQASTHSWRAMFFGSFDSSNFISVDKTPGSLWVMDLSARVFGVNSWSILVPQALEGVATAGLLYATVRRRFGAAAGLIAGAVMAVSPVAALMFRFNNPDALLVLCLVGSAYAVTRAIESGRTGWLVLAGALVGAGFLAKMLQALLVVPGFGLVYLCCAPVPLRRRVRQLLAAGAAVIVAAGWWVAVVALTPAADRPYVGGSTDNNILNLIFGYNGFGRLTGRETGSVGGGGPGTVGRWGPTGLTRLFGTDMGSQISWLLPAALLLGATVLWLIRHSPRTDTARAQILLWGSWLVVTGITFSFSKGIIHPYYTVALAPAIGALVGIGAVALWRSRRLLLSRLALAVVVAVTAIWAEHLMTRSADFHPWLRGFVIVVGLVVAGAALIPPDGLRRLVRWPAVVAAAALVVGFTGPLAWSLQTASTAHTGAIPSAGPVAVGSNASVPGRGPGRRGFGSGGFRPPGGFGPGAQAFGGRNPFGRGGLFPFAGGGGGGVGNLIQAGTPSPAITAALRADASSYSWAAAAVGGEVAAGYQLAAAEPVMAIGGFNGTDPAPTLASFEHLVSQGRIHYFIGSGRGLFAGFVGGRSRSGSSTDASQIEQWVESHFQGRSIGGATMYDLSIR
jgi:4-amino-4-deoxy-L-arabinose transferase-like glycosyltransferase